MELIKEAANRISGVDYEITSHYDSPTIYVFIFHKKSFASTSFKMDAHEFMGSPIDFILKYENSFSFLKNKVEKP